MTSPISRGLLALTFVAAFVAIVVDAVVVRYAWRRRSTAGSLSLAALVAASGWWVIAYVAELVVSEPALESFFACAEWLGILYGPVAWFCFVLAYTGRDRHLTPRGVATIAALPTALFVGVWTNDSHHLIWTALVHAPVYGRFDVLVHAWGLGCWIALGYGGMLVATGATVLLATTVSLPAPYPLQMGVPTAGVVLPGIIGVLIALVGFRPALAPVIPTTLACVGLACALSIRWFDLLESRPLPIATARACALEQADDAILVLDDHGRVVDANPAAHDLFADNGAPLRDTPASDFLPDGARADGMFASTVDGTTRFFDIVETPVDDAHGRSMGCAIVLRDVTDRRHRTQRLEVLNRVLRHNLRNQVNVIAGYADLLAAETPADRSDLSRYAAAIERSVGDLADTAEKARTIERIAQSNDGRAVDGRLVVTEAVATVQREHPKATITVALDGLSKRGGTVPWQVEPVVENLVENATEHNPAPDPSVHVVAAREGHEVVVRVRDNGPGIPETERRTLEAGHETALVHGEGLGLWIACWGARAAGGDIAFRDREDGTDVVVRVPVSE